ncbi:MAG: FlgD immunoglobulin-like domain containing protein [Candidatus Cloacimonetes bacterium]|nr:FlgD immunoglobulin-like domain containing protein [Candidatus Cloacimonadota bacterium]
MKEPNNNSFSEFQYEQLISFCAFKNSQNFAYLNLAAEIANAVLLILLKESQTDGFNVLIQDYAQALYPKAVEKVFASYQRSIFKSCFAQTRDMEISHDIAQEDNPAVANIVKAVSNYPNPFNPSTTIRYSVPKDGGVNLFIYNTRGQLVRTLVNERRKKGNYTVIWNGKDNSGNTVSSGVYFSRILSNGKSRTSKMLMMK